MSRCARPWLLPLTPLYAAGAAIAARMKSVQQLKWPVISVGNLSTGGSGKTPLTIELARLLSEAGVGVDILSRGYGRKSDGAMRVNPQGSAEEFGDEPLLMAQRTGLPVYVARQRYEAGLLAERELGGGSGVRVHLLDDGMQHRQLHRDVEIVSLSRHDWEDCLLPAGNLREPLKAIRRASVVAIAEDEPELERNILDIGFQGLIWKLKRTMDVSATLARCGVKSGEPVAAFCGIARPEQFFNGIESVGVQLADKKAFPDHHVYTDAELDNIIDAARKTGAKALLTTEKDLARLGAQRQLLEAVLPVAAVRLRTEIQEADEALRWLLGKVGSEQLV